MLYRAHTVLATSCALKSTSRRSAFIAIAVNSTASGRSAVASDQAMLAISWRFLLFFYNIFWLFCVFSFVMTPNVGSAALRHP